MTPEPPPFVEPPVARKPCPFCHEEIALSAVKCRFCGEYLDGREAPRKAAEWNPGVAMVLSFLIPGLGQIYKGQPFNGIAWFVVAVLGYFFFIVPGLLIHLCAIIGAGTGKPR